MTSSCAEDVTAVLGTDAPYSLFGVLSPQLQRQVVRVYSIDGVLQPIPPLPLDAEVVSTELSTGEVRIWRDSIVTESDGMNAHVFISPFAARYGDTYQIVATRSDGLQTRVSATVPEFSDLVLPPSEMTPPPVLEARVTGTPPNLIRVEVVYEYRFQDFSGIRRDSTAISYQGVGSQQQTAFVIPIQVSRDSAVIRALLKERFGFEVEIKVVRIRLTLIVANREWSPPGGSFDRDILVEPGTMSNVQNGFGFVGAGFRLSRSWTPTDTLFVKR